ncbi:MAG: glycosyl hydrolase, partial [Verrucomicrobiota bacterium]
TNTLQGWLPHHYRTTQNNLAFKPYTYLTPRGSMKLAAGNQFELDYPFRGIAPVLPAPHANNVPNDYVASRMTNYLMNFAAGHPGNVADTYWGGKDMSLTAQNIGFARQLGMTNQLNQMVSGLRGVLTNWLTYTPGESQFFFARYDNWRALVGFPSDFGSESFTDNHFHYGYFMTTAALLGMEDASFLNQYGPMAKLVARQYANWDRADTSFPFLRTFDIWEGHSWASGFSSGGGCNQESTSEAINSWVGVFLLGSQLGDNAMAAAGAMGYAVESAAVNEYWQDMHHTNLPASYGKGMVGIVSSSGIAYGTFFSGDPAWIFGIQWVPANHWNNYLARDKTFANWQLTNMWNERVIADQYSLSGFTLTDANNATALGGYLGNYVLGYQALFDPAGVAAIMDAAFTNNAAIATDAAYSGVTYYLTHSLRALGDQDLDYYTSIPTSQVFFNASTGQRTSVIYNPNATSQTATIYHLGVPIETVTVPAGKLTVNVSGQTNQPSPIHVNIQAGAQINWPTTLNTSWTLQSADAPGTNVAWTALLGPTPGDGSTQTFFDPLWPAAHRQYQVLETASGTASIVVNGEFENGSGSSADNWSAAGSQPPTRVSTEAHSGGFSLQILVTNATATPNTSEINQNIKAQGGIPVVGGQAYTFSFWAKKISSGVSYVQNYRITWLDSGGANVGTVGWTGFTAGNGVWSQITASNLVAPANAVNAFLQIYGATGAVLNGFGGVWLDDIALSFGTASETNQFPAVAQPAVQIRWPSSANKLYDVQRVENLGGNVWTNLASSIAGNGSTNAVSDVFGTNEYRFYRVVEFP